MPRTELTALPNIGKTLAQLLQSVGIETIEDLFSIGSENAFIRIYTVDREACYSKLCALEGAIRGIRWHDLSPERKMELKMFYHHTTQPDKKR